MADPVASAKSRSGLAVRRGDTPGIATARADLANAKAARLRTEADRLEAEANALVASITPQEHCLQETDQ